MSRFKTIKEATEAWVHEMNAIPQGMILRLFQDHPDDLYVLPVPFHRRYYLRLLRRDAL